MPIWIVEWQAIMHPHIPAVVPLVTQCVKDDWYKIIAEALRVVGVVIVIIRPIDNESNMFKEVSALRSPEAQSVA